MAKNTDKVAESLFEKIRTRFENVSIGDEEANSTVTPSTARYFNFNYQDKAGKKFGNVTISLLDNEGLKVYYGMNMSADLDDEQKKDWYAFLKDLRMFAMRNMIKFDTRDISKGSLTVKDIYQLSKSAGPKSSNDIAESKLYGTAKTSYEIIAPGTRMVVRHSSPVDEAVHGARTRKIHAVYIEDIQGQRLKSPFTNLTGNRALAQHIASGGQMHDDFSQHIAEMVEECTKLRQFVNGSRHKTFEDADANEMVGIAKDRFTELRSTLTRLKSPRGQSMYKESWTPSNTLMDDIDMDLLKGKFVQKNFDPRLEPALPYVQKEYMRRKSTIEEHLSAFEQSLNQISEGTWAVPDNEESIQSLQELMAEVLPAGIDGVDATGALYHIIGDDDLFDSIYDASRGSPDMDVRPIIYDWLRVNMPSVFEKVKGNMESGGQDQEAQQQPKKPQKPKPAPETQEESVDPIADVRRLAGFSKSR